MDICGRALAGDSISTSRQGQVWVITARRRELTFDPATLRITVHAGAETWTLRPSRQDDIIVQTGQDRACFRLADAARKTVTPFDTGERAGIKVVLEGFAQGGHRADFSVTLTVAFEPVEEELLCEAMVSDAATAAPGSPSDGPVVKEIAWPGAFETTRSDWTVIPWGQGGLVPGDWPQEFSYAGGVTLGSLTMTWWGHQRGSAAVMVIPETYADADVRWKHPAGGPMVMENVWLHSLGAMRYPRRTRIVFFDNGNYVALCKRYRRHVIDNGLFVPLAAKIARTPRLAQLIGSPVVHTSILYHTQPASSYHDKNDPSKNHQLTTFADRASHLRKLHGRGVRRAYVHLDGWGFRGYDNLHPDPLPPSPEAGGWEGFRLLADTCEQLGYVFIIHDQYRDYYLDAPSYREDCAVLDEKGKRHQHATWAGGDQQLLCSAFAPGHVRKNFGAMLANGVKVRGSYLDVFSLVALDECYNVDHPVTRSQCIANRAECFRLIRNLPGGGVISSECATDWAVPHLDLVHHSPYPGLGKIEGTTEAGWTVPLFNLVFHDALVVPWMLGRGKDQFQPPGDWGFLHALLNGSMPYLSIDPAEDELQQVRTLCALNRRVGIAEMVSHEFLDGNHRRARTRFADGTTVTADFTTEKWDIAPPISESEMGRAFDK